MNINQLHSLQMARATARPRGHAHFWQRAGLTRRQFVKAGAASAAVAMFGAGLLQPSRAIAAPHTGRLPNPVPGGTTIDGLGTFHFYFPTANPFSTDTIESGGGDPSTITDFNGKVGVSEMFGGVGTGSEGTQYWNSDVRFFDGEYVDVRGKHHQGTFAFI
jgi:hypothetical protein